MIIEKFGKKNIIEFLDRFSLESMIPDSILDISLFVSKPQEYKCVSIEEMYEDKETIQKMLAHISSFSPLSFGQEFSTFERSNYKQILVAIMDLPLRDMPLMVNAKYRFVKEIAKWRMTIGI